MPPGSERPHDGDTLIGRTLNYCCRQVIARARYAAAQIISGNDDKLIVVVGPCSIHSTEQAIAYAKLLKEAMPRWDNLLIIMRSYFEKPRTNVGCQFAEHHVRTPASDTDPTACVTRRERHVVAYSPVSSLLTALSQV